MAAERYEISMQEVWSSWLMAQGEKETGRPYCSFCGSSSLNWYNHWQMGEVLNICHQCFGICSLLQCSDCLGMGTYYDILVLNRNEHLCPNCCRRRLDVDPE